MAQLNKGVNLFKLGLSGRTGKIAFTNEPPMTEGFSTSSHFIEKAEGETGIFVYLNVDVVVYQSIDGADWTEYGRISDVSSFEAHNIPWNADAQYMHFVTIFQTDEPVSIRCISATGPMVFDSTPTSIDETTDALKNADTTVTIPVIGGSVGSGKDGEDGKDGASALDIYRIAVGDPTATEDDFIKAITGKSAFQSWKDTAPEGEDRSEASEADFINSLGSADNSKPKKLYDAEDEERWLIDDDGNFVPAVDGLKLGSTTRPIDHAHIGNNSIYFGENKSLGEAGMMEFNGTIPTQILQALESKGMNLKEELKRAGVRNLRELNVFHLEILAKRAELTDDIATIIAADSNVRDVELDGAIPLLDEFFGKGDVVDGQMARDGENLFVFHKESFMWKLLHNVSKIENGHQLVWVLRSCDGGEQVMTTFPVGDYAKAGESVKAKDGSCWTVESIEEDGPDNENLLQGGIIAGFETCEECLESQLAAPINDSLYSSADEVKARIKELEGLIHTAKLTVDENTKAQTEFTRNIQRMKEFLVKNPDSEKAQAILTQNQTNLESSVNLIETNIDNITSYQKEIEQLMILLETGSFSGEKVKEESFGIEVVDERGETQVFMFGDKRSLGLSFKEEPAQLKDVADLLNGDAFLYQSNCYNIVGYIHDQNSGPRLNKNDYKNMSFFDSESTCASEKSKILEERELSEYKEEALTAFDRLRGIEAKEIRTHWFAPDGTNLAGMTSLESLLNTDSDREMFKVSLNIASEMLNEGPELPFTMNERGEVRFKGDENASMPGFRSMESYAPANIANIGNYVWALTLTSKSIDDNAKDEFKAEMPKDEEKMFAAHEGKLADLAAADGKADTQITLSKLNQYKKDVIEAMLKVFSKGTEDMVYVAMPNLKKGITLDAVTSLNDKDRNFYIGTFIPKVFDNLSKQASIFEGVIDRMQQLHEVDGDVEIIHDELVPAGDVMDVHPGKEFNVHESVLQQNAYEVEGAMHAEMLGAEVLNKTEEVRRLAKFLTDEKGLQDAQNFIEEQEVGFPFSGVYHMEDAPLDSKEYWKGWYRNAEYTDEYTKVQMDMLLEYHSTVSTEEVAITENLSDDQILAKISEIVTLFEGEGPQVKTDEDAQKFRALVQEDPAIGPFIGQIPLSGDWMMFRKDGASRPGTSGYVIENVPAWAMEEVIPEDKVAENFEGTTLKTILVNAYKKANQGVSEEPKLHPSDEAKLSVAKAYLEFAKLQSTKSTEFKTGFLSHIAAAEQQDVENSLDAVDAIESQISEATEDELTVLKGLRDKQETLANDGEALEKQLKDKTAQETDNEAKLFGARALEASNKAEMKTKLEEQNALAEDIATANNELESVKSSIDEFNSKLTELNSEIVTTNDEIAGYQTTIDNSAITLGQKADEKDVKSEEKNTNEAIIKNNKENTGSVTDAIEGKEDTESVSIEGLEAVDGLEAAVGGVHTLDVATWKQRLEIFNNAIAAGETANQLLEEAIEQIDGEMDALQQVIKNSQKAKTDAEEKVSELTQNKENTEANLQESTEFASELESSITENNAKFNKLNDDTLALAQTIQQLLEDIATYQALETQIRNDKAALDESITLNRAEFDKVNEQVNQSIDKINKEVEKSEESVDQSMSNALKDWHEASKYGFNSGSHYGNFMEDGIGSMNQAIEGAMKLWGYTRIGDYSTDSFSMFENGQFISEEKLNAILAEDRWSSASFEADWQHFYGVLTGEVSVSLEALETAARKPNATAQELALGAFAASFKWMTYDLDRQSDGSKATTPVTTSDEVATYFSAPIKEALRQLGFKIGTEGKWSDAYKTALSEGEGGTEVQRVVELSNRYYSALKQYNSEVELYNTLVLEHGEESKQVAEQTGRRDKALKELKTREGFVAEHVSMTRETIVSYNSSEAIERVRRNDFKYKESNAIFDNYDPEYVPGFVSQKDRELKDLQSEMSTYISSKQELSKLDSRHAYYDAIIKRYSDRIEEITKHFDNFSDNFDSTEYVSGFVTDFTREKNAVDKLNESLSTLESQEQDKLALIEGKNTLKAMAHENHDKYETEFTDADDKKVAAESTVKAMQKVFNTREQLTDANGDVYVAIDSEDNYVTANEGQLYHSDIVTAIALIGAHQEEADAASVKQAAETVKINNLTSEIDALAKELESISKDKEALREKADMQNAMFEETFMPVVEGSNKLTDFKKEVAGDLVNAQEDLNRTSGKVNDLQKQVKEGESVVESLSNSLNRMLEQSPNYRAYSDKEGTELITDRPFSMAGYYPGFHTKEAADSFEGGDGTSHSHELTNVHGATVTVHMPNGLIMDKTQFHGDHFFHYDAKANGAGFGEINAFTEVMGDYHKTKNELDENKATLSEVLKVFNAANQLVTVINEAVATMEKDLDISISPEQEALKKFNDWKNVNIVPIMDSLNRGYHSTPLSFPAVFNPNELGQKYTAEPSREVGNKLNLIGDEPGVINPLTFLSEVSNEWFKFVNSFNEDNGTNISTSFPETGLQDMMNEFIDMGFEAGQDEEYEVQNPFWRSEGYGMINNSVSALQLIASNFDSEARKLNEDFQQLVNKIKHTPEGDASFGNEGDDFSSYADFIEKLFINHVKFRILWNRSRMLSAKSTYVADAETMEVINDQIEKNNIQPMKVQFYTFSKFESFLSDDPDSINWNGSSAEIFPRRGFQLGTTKPWRVAIKYNMNAVQSLINQGVAEEEIFAGVKVRKYIQNPEAWSKINPDSGQPRGGSSNHAHIDKCKEFDEKFENLDKVGTELYMVDTSYGDNGVETLGFKSKSASHPNTFATHTGYHKELFSWDPNIGNTAGVYYEFEFWGIMPEDFTFVNKLNHDELWPDSRLFSWHSNTGLTVNITDWGTFGHGDLRSTFKSLKGYQSNFSSMSVGARYFHKDGCTYADNSASWRKTGSYASEGTRFVVTADNTPNLSRCNVLGSVLEGFSWFESLNNWDLSNVTNFSGFLKDFARKAWQGISPDYNNSSGSDELRFWHTESDFSKWDLSNCYQFSSWGVNEPITDGQIERLSEFAPTIGVNVENGATTWYMWQNIKNIYMEKDAEAINFPENTKHAHIFLNIHNVWAYMSKTKSWNFYNLEGGVDSVEITTLDGVTGYTIGEYYQLRFWRIGGKLLQMDWTWNFKDGSMSVVNMGSKPISNGSDNGGLGPNPA